MFDILDLSAHAQKQSETILDGCTFHIIQLSLVGSVLSQINTQGYVALKIVVVGELTNSVLVSIATGWNNWSYDNKSRPGTKTKSVAGFHGPNRKVSTISKYMYI